MLALSQDLAQNRPVEAREHVRRFHTLFFSFAPDKSAIEDNINRALLMADRSAVAYYNNLAEAGDRKSTRLNSSHREKSRMPSSA